MKLSTVNETNAVLYSRKEYVVKVDYESGATPKKEDVKKKLVDHLKCKEELIVLGGFDQKFGNCNFDVKVKVYDNVESLKESEKVKEEKVKEGEKKEEKPVESKDGKEENTSKEQKA